MAQKVSKKYSLNVQGVISFDDDGTAYVSVEDRGDFEINELLKDFSDKECCPEGYPTHCIFSAR